MIIYETIEELENKVSELEKELQRLAKGPVEMINERDLIKEEKKKVESMEDRELQWATDIVYVANARLGDWMSEKLEPLEPYKDLYESYKNKMKTEIQDLDNRIGKVTKDIVEKINHYNKARLQLEIKKLEE